MPAGDGTGPLGLGPMTGRRAGYCAGYGVPGYANPAVPRLGLGWRRGWGAGWGRGWPGRWAGGWGGGWRWRHWYYATGVPGWARYGAPPAWSVPPVAPYAAAPTPEQEVDLLRNQAEWLKEQLEAIEQRITELEQKEE